MNIVFFGSSKFAAFSLKEVVASRHRVVCVVTQPDKQKGRGLHFAGTVIKSIASQAGINIYQPSNVNALDTAKLLKDLNPDLSVVIAYGQILSQEILDIPKIFSINVHASLLPNYRGAAPINWAIIKGEKKTGITIIKMTDQMDAGQILFQKETDINDFDTAITLEDKLSALAAESLLTALSSIEDNNYNLQPQDERNVSFAPKLKKEDGRIDWSQPAQEILNLIRGCINWPGAFTYYNDKLLKIYKARVLPYERSLDSPLPGSIMDVSKEGITVVTGKDRIIIEELQIEGKRIMSAKDFIAGHKISIAQTFDKK
jgi:methionyl-tRNA formyltransferase